MWSLPAPSDPECAWFSAGRLFAALLLAGFALETPRSPALAVTLAALPTAGDLLVHYRGNLRAPARSVAGRIAFVFILLYVLDAGHIVPDRWIARTFALSRDSWEAGHSWTPFTAQFVHRGWLSTSAQTIVFLLLGVRVESLLGSRAFLGLVLLAVLFVACSAMPAAPPVRIHGAAGITLCLGIAWPVLLATRSPWSRARAAEHLRHAWLVVFPLGLVTLWWLALDRDASEAPLTLPLSAVCGLGYVAGFRIRQRRRTVRLLREFRRRKSARVRRWSQVSSG